MRKKSASKALCNYFKTYSRQALFLFLTFIFLQNANALPSINHVDENNEIKDISQNNTSVRGTVKDQNGEPLIGVSIVVKGTTNGTVSDLDGTFILGVSDPNATLVFTFIGFHTQEVALKRQTNLNIVLVEDAKMLDDVVVVGYGTLKRSDIATAVVSLKPEDFNYGGARDPMSLLEGKVAGLQVTRTGGSDPNSGVAYQLRGVTSFTGSQQPLIVIDGIPDGNMDLIQPNDIESIEVLKDGAAAAIYGSRANAGVILVTTKQGKVGKTSIEYSTYFTRHTVAKRPDFLDADDYRRYMNDPNNPKAGQMKDFGYSTDFYDELINKSNLTQSHNLSISGGSGSTNFRASIYFNDFQGIGKQDERKTYGGKVSLNTKGYDDMLTVQVNLATNYNYANRINDSSSGSKWVWETAKTLNPTLPIDGEQEKSINPLNRIRDHKYKKDEQVTALSSKISLEPIKDLRFSIFGSIQRKTFINSEYINVKSWESKEAYEDLGKAFKETEMDTKGAVEPTIEYSALIKEKHSINAVAGYSFQYNIWEKHNAENRGFLNDLVQENDLGAGSYLGDGKAKMESKKEEDKLIAFFGRINYSYDSRYVAQISLRHEGSTKFGANNKWGNFPSYSVAWNATNEEFMKQFEFLNLLKVRVGYGVTGNSGIDRYKSIGVMGTGGFYYAPDGTWKQSYGPGEPNPNPNLKWEKKQEWNFGIDFGFLNNRIGGSIDIFNRTTKDLLEEYIAQQPSYIFDKIYTNVGDVTSKGFEVTLNTIPVVTKNFMWKSDLTASHAVNKVKSFSNDLYKIEYKNYGAIGGSGALGDAIRTYEGDKIGNFYGKRFAGFTDEGKWLFYNAENEKVLADAIKDGDMAVIGNGVPKLYMSWSNYLRYKDFDLTIMFRGKFGFDVLNRMEMAYGNKITLPTNILRSAMTTHAELNDTYQYSDYYLEKGDFVKLDNLTVGYNFKSKSGNPKIPQFRIYFTARDLFTITGYDGLDPEVKDTGLDPGLDARDRYPITRSFTLGLNVKF